MLLGRGKASPRRSIGSRRPGSAKRPKGRAVGSMALIKATRTLNTVAVPAVDSVTQRGNIKVVVRVRPVNTRESTANSRVVVHAVDNHMVVFDPPDEERDFFFKGVKQACPQKFRHKNTKLAFDNVYGPESTNSEIFDDVIKPMLDTLLNGFNCSVFAYGATGAGKTHTMLGNASNPGLTFLTVMELYQRLEDMSNDYDTEVTVSYLEVYNETVKDLLHSSGDLQIREDSNGVVVPCLTSHKPTDANALLKLLSFGNSVRSQHPTDHNSESSRSHAVFQVCVNLRSRFTELTSKYKSAKLVMVDLAGSERGAATGFQGKRFREGASINKSLLALGNCINALADGKKHIPFRDSKLTRILKDSLGGNCKTVMIANVSPSSLSYDDSYNTLRYADRAKRIKCQVKKNTMSVTACLTQYKVVVEEMSHKIDQLQGELTEFKSQCKCLVPKVDASTEPRELFANLGAGDCQGTCHSSLPSEIVHQLSELMHGKEEANRILYDATTTAAKMALRISVKERRINSIKKFKSLGAIQTKNSQKLRKQIDPLRTRYQEALSKKSNALDCLRHLDTQYEKLEASTILNNRDDTVPMKLADYLELQQLRVDAAKSKSLKNFYKDSTHILSNEWQKNERILGKSVEFFSSQYLMNKHFNHNTRQMDEEYEGLVADLCGARVHWSSDMDSNEDQPLGPNLKDILDESNLGGDAIQESDYSEGEDLPHASRTGFRRPATPPRKNTLRSDDTFDLSSTEDDDTSELETFRSESSILNAITKSRMPVDELNVNPEANGASASTFIFENEDSPKGMDSIENQDLTVTSGPYSPVPCFAQDFTMRYNLTEIEQASQEEELPMDITKENINPLTYRAGSPTYNNYQPVDTTFEVTLSNLNPDSTFDLGTGKRSFDPPSTGSASETFVRSPSSTYSNIPTSEMYRSTGFPNRSASKKTKTITMKGKSPVAQTSAQKAAKFPSSALSYKNTFGQSRQGGNNVSADSRGNGSADSRGNGSADSRGNGSADSRSNANNNRRWRN